MNESKQSEQLYFDVQQKTDKQHILDNPDTYIGSVEIVDTDMWIMKDDSDTIIKKNISYIPGLFKLFDEGIVNCRDHVIRMQSKIESNVENSLPVSYINISISDDGIITMTNDGNGIDVVKHPQYDTWVPELIFGHLRTSTNYNKDEKKIVGGKNGFGFKLVLIWSSYGYIETVDHIRGLKYTQEFKDNLDIICEPKITKNKSKPYTKIIFKPDYQRLGIHNLSTDMINLLKKRVYDISAITDKTIKVKYNSQIIPVKNFENYINLYIGDKSTSPRAYESPNERWEYTVALSLSNEFVQISFVNGIYTSKGGKHVEYILNQIIRKLSEYIEKKKKIKVHPNTIKEQLILFLRCDIENPSFDSQTKDFMNTPMVKFGSKCDVSDKFIEKLAKMGLMDVACAITEVKEQKVAKKSDGMKTKHIRGIPKLDDANWAGTEKSKDCIIIFCEGDSAKTGIRSGLTSEDNNYIGVYPCKGKLMNTRGETIKKINENKEINDIKKILGLENGKEYHTIDDVHKCLRYSKIVLMVDQDLDGSHIKGLFINLFQSEWSSLTKIPGFISFMNTPLLKATLGKTTIPFYNIGEYNEWKNTVTNNKKWSIKYFKGLGTSQKNDFREYFKEKKYIGFIHTGQPSDDAIDMVFNKKRADDRKYWLENTYDRNSFLDTRKPMITYEEFVNKEFIKFSIYDCDRSIPNLIDGLKISLRKILYCAFKKNLTTEIKVAQFTGYVSEQSGYHHGEDSLNKAIVGMAQNFMGSNNINLLYPSGQFGSRIAGGQDNASPRYIYTRLENITRLIYPEQDDYILNYLDDDGKSVEPQFYVPIIPMILVNGTKGIGTGFSTNIMCYNPIDIITYLKNKLNRLENETTFYPYYDGFIGDTIQISETKYLFKGKYEKISADKIRVYELPIGHWTYNFKELLIELQNDKDSEGKRITPIIKDFLENYTDVTVEFIITFTQGKVNELESITAENCNGLEKTLKLVTSGTTTNMNLFNHNDKLTKYNSVAEIIDDYYVVRLEYYMIRKRNMIACLEKQLVIAHNKARYIQEILNDTIDLRKKKKDEIISMLVNKNYDIIDDEDEEFKYLVQMPMDSVSDEKVGKLLKEYENKQVELNKIKNTTIEQMWITELELLEQEYKIFKEQREYAKTGISNKVKAKVSKKCKM